LEKANTSISLVLLTTEVHSWQSSLQPLGRAKSTCTFEGQMFWLGHRS